MSIGLVDYDNSFVPEGYLCLSCGKRGIKLWRAYGSFDAVELRCCDCAGKREGVDVSKITADGRLFDGDTFITDSIGWHVPAVPMPDGWAFFGYTTVPPSGVSWWKRLPTRLNDVTHRGSILGDFIEREHRMFRRYGRAPIGWYYFGRGVENEDKDVVVLPRYLRRKLARGQRFPASLLRSEFNALRASLAEELRGRGRVDILCALGLS